MLPASALPPPPCAFLSPPPQTQRTHRRPCRADYSQQRRRRRSCSLILRIRHIQILSSPSRCALTAFPDALAAPIAKRPHAEKWGLHRRHRAVRIRIAIVLTQERVGDANHMKYQKQSARSLHRHSAQQKSHRAPTNRRWEERDEGLPRPARSPLQLKEATDATN